MSQTQLHHGLVASDQPIESISVRVASFDYRAFLRAWRSCVELRGGNLYRIALYLLELGEPVVGGYLLIRHLPDGPSIGRELGIGLNEPRRALKRLETLGLLQPSRKIRDSRCYELLPQPGWHVPADLQLLLPYSSDEEVPAAYDSGEERLVEDIDRPDRAGGAWEVPAWRGGHPAERPYPPAQSRRFDAVEDLQTGAIAPVRRDCGGAFAPVRRNRAGLGHPLPLTLPLSRAAAAAAPAPARAREGTAAVAPDVLDALIAAGLDGRLLAQAQAIEGLTVALIVDVATACDRSGKGPPIVLAELRRRVSKQAARRRLDAARSRLAPAAVASVERDELASHRQADLAVVASLDDATVERLKAEHLATLPPASRCLMAKRDPRSFFLAGAIAALARQQADAAMHAKTDRAGGEVAGPITDAAASGLTDPARR